MQLLDHVLPLLRLGIFHARDLAQFRENDLVREGIPTRVARQILSVGVPPATEISSMMSPQPTLNKAAEAGLLRGKRPAGVVFASSVLGGCFLSFGGMMYVTLAGGTPYLQSLLPGLHAVMCAAVFPIGLSMVVFTGTDLLTSNMMYHCLPFLTHPHRNVQFKVMMKVWAISFLGNLLGSCMCAATVTFWGNFAIVPFSTFVAAVCVKKTSLPFFVAFTKGVAANWLVNVAVYMALTSRSAGGKIAALWIPITTFVALGMEHSVANMFLIPLGIFGGNTAVTWPQFFEALVPVVLGNAVGATFFVSFMPWYTDWYSQRPVSKK